MALSRHLGGFDNWSNTDADTEKKEVACRCRHHRKGNEENDGIHARAGENPSQSAKGGAAAGTYQKAEGRRRDNPSQISMFLRFTDCDCCRQFLAYIREGQIAQIVCFYGQIIQIYFAVECTP